MSSNCAAGNAPEAPLPASPMRCSEPMFVAKIEAPTMNQPALRPARKNSVGFLRFAAPWRNTTAYSTTKYAAMTSQSAAVSRLIGVGSLLDGSL